MIRKKDAYASSKIALILRTPALLASLSDREKAITCMWYGIGCARHSVEDIAEIGLLTPQRVQRIMDRIKIKLTE